MVPEPAATPFFFGNDIAAAEAQVIEAVVVDAPHIDAAGGRAVQVAKAVARVFDASAEAGPALAQIIEIEIPLDALHRLEPEQLERVDF